MQVSAMNCPQCGSANEEGSRQCTECGASLAKSGETTVMLSPVGLPDEEVFADIASLVADHPVLVVTKGPFRGQYFELLDSEITLGRDPGSDIFLDDITVSRKHAKITVSDDSVLVSDLCSLNGTYVNQERQEQAQLKAGDELQIGKFKMLFLSGKPQAES